MNEIKGVTKELITKVIEENDITIEKVILYHIEGYEMNLENNFVSIVDAFYHYASLINLVEYKILKDHCE